MDKKKYLKILGSISKLDKKITELAQCIEFGSIDHLIEYLCITNDDYDFKSFDRDDLDLEDYDSEFIWFRDRFTDDAWRMPVAYLDEEYRNAMLAEHEQKRARKEQIQADLDRERKEHRHQLYLTLKQEFEP